MDKLSDNVKLFLLFGIAVALLITVSVLIVDDGDSVNGLETSFCENFTISDDAVRQIFANSVGDVQLSVTNPNLQCLPEQIFDKLSDEEIEIIETSFVYSLAIEAPLVAVHPDAFKTKMDIRRIAAVTLDDTPDGNIIERGDRLLEPFSDLFILRLNTSSTSVSDTLVGEIDTLRTIEFRGSSNLEILPTFVENQIFLERLNFDNTAIAEPQEGFFSDMERFTFISVSYSTTPLRDASSLTESDIAEIYETDTDHLNGRFSDLCSSFRFTDQDIRKDMRNNVNFDSDTNTTIIDLFVDCFPNNLFSQFSEEELFALFPQDRDTTLLINSPLEDFGFNENEIFIESDGLFDRVTTVIIQGTRFDSMSSFEAQIFRNFIALQEVIFRENKPREFGSVLNQDIIGDPCKNATKTIRFINTLDFTSFPEMLRFCPLIERLDFTGSLDFIGLNSEVLESLENLNELILTNTAIAIEEEGNKTAIADILQVPEEIIVVN